MTMIRFVRLYEIKENEHNGKRRKWLKNFLEKTDKTDFNQRETFNSPLLSLQLDCFFDAIPLARKKRTKQREDKFFPEVVGECH